MARYSKIIPVDPMSLREQERPGPCTIMKFKNGCRIKKAELEFTAEQKEAALIASKSRALKIWETRRRNQKLKEAKHD